MNYEEADRKLGISWPIRCKIEDCGFMGKGKCQVLEPSMKDLQIGGFYCSGREI